MLISFLRSLLQDAERVSRAVSALEGLAPLIPQFTSNLTEMTSFKEQVLAVLAIGVQQKSVIAQLEAALAEKAGITAALQAELDKLHVQYNALLFQEEAEEKAEAEEDAQAAAEKEEILGAIKESGLLPEPKPPAVDEPPVSPELPAEPAPVEPAEPIEVLPVELEPPVEPAPPSDPGSITLEEGEPPTTGNFGAFPIN